MRVSSLVICVGLSSASPLPANVWRPDADDFVYPELAAKANLTHLDGRDNFGIALAGGGLRGFGLAHGTTRAFREAGILDRARYYSVTSGSVWFGLPMYYQTQDKLHDFLGTSLSPDKLTTETLTGSAAGTAVTRLHWPITKVPEKPEDNHEWTQSAGGSKSFYGLVSKPESLDDLQAFIKEDASLMAIFNRVNVSNINLKIDPWDCMRDICACATDFALPIESLHEVWMWVTGVLMDPYDLITPDSTYCHPSDLESTRARLGDDVRIYVSQDVEHKLPFFISQSAIFSLESGSDQATNPLKAFPYENTPLYSGVPVSLSAEHVAPEKLKGLGGVLVEPFAASSKALEAVPEGGSGQMLVEPFVNYLNFGSLVEWEGAVTCYAAAWQIRPNVVDIVQKVPCLRELSEKIMPHSNMWSPLDTDESGIPVTHNLAIGDAGVYDDLGHLPLLRRGVNKMVILDSSAVHDDVDDTNIEEMVYLKAAFGAAGGLKPPNPKGAPNPMMAENYLTVFEPSEFAALWDTIKAQRAAGEPAVVRGTYTTVDNVHFGIDGGKKVDIVWIIAMPSQKWRAALPAETADKLAKYLPNVISSEPRSQFELSALAQYGSWLAEQVVIPEIKAMLDAEDPVVV